MPPLEPTGRGPTTRVALGLGRQTTGGIARFALELALALDRRDDIELLPVGPVARLQSFVDNGGVGTDLIEVPATSASGEAAFVLGRLGGRVTGAGAEVLHCTKHFVPVRSSLPTLLTVHDLSLLRGPGDGQPLSRWLRPRMYARSIRSADRVVAVSSQVSDAVRERFRGVDPVTITHAPPTRLLAAEPVRIEGLRPGGFALFVGDLNRRKNPGFLFDLWEAVRRERDLVLVVAGGDGRPTAELHRAAERGAASGQVVVIGPIDDGRLRWLYESCAVVCVPSIDEGFGLPVVEASALGAPVIASDLPVFRELAVGRPGVTLRPLDPDAWVELLRHESPRADVGPPVGPTWDEIAADYAAVYRGMLGRASTPARPVRRSQTEPVPSATPTVVLDCRWLAWSGAGRVTSALAAGLAELSPSQRWILWGPDATAGLVWPGAEWAPSNTSPTAWRGQRDWRGVPPADLVLFMHQQRPLRAVRAVTMILDTQPLRFNRGRLDAWQKRLFLRRVSRISEHILTISEFSKERIEQDLGVEPGRITAVHLPIDPDMSRRVLERRGSIAQEDLALYIGLFLDHKNLPRLIDAFGRTEFCAGGGRLLLVGGKERAGVLRETLSDRQRGFVEIVPFCSQDELEHHLAKARLLIQPSLEEGYGLPVAEALAAGVDVCASEAGALPQSARGLATLFGPLSVEGMAAAIDATANVSRARTDHGASLAATYQQDAPRPVDLAREVLDVIERYLSVNRSGV